MKFKYKNGKTHITIDDIDPKIADFSTIEGLVYKYGYDFKGNPITAPDGYEIITKYEKIKKDFIHFDIYGGWTKGSYDYQINRGFTITMGKGGYSDGMGRWICWAKPIK